MLINKTSKSVQTMNINISDSVAEKCCNKIEVYYEIKNDAYSRWSIIYDIYTKMTEGVNNQSSYQSDFFDGIYGIWLSDCNKWMIGYITSKGQCSGYARAKPNSTEECIENVGWNWDYSISDGWKEAKEGLGVKCIDN